MFSVRGISLNKADNKIYYSILVIFTGNSFKRAHTIYFDKVDTLAEFKIMLSQELKCNIEYITFAPWLDFALLGLK